jgi:hypothetical protein
MFFHCLPQRRRLACCSCAWMIIEVVDDVSASDDGVDAEHPQARLASDVEDDKHDAKKPKLEE